MSIRTKSEIKGSRQSPQPARHLPGEEGVWVFILLDLMAFGMFFAAYIFTRAGEVAIFDQSQEQLSQPLGVVNTLLLVTASWLVAAAVKTVRVGQGRTASIQLFCALLLGLGFIMSKAIEYTELFEAGVGISSNNFFMFYFCLTLIHLLHTVIGCVILAVLAFSARGGQYSAGKMTGLESGASYWHMVDLLWLILFPLLYMLR
jgi:nitric oxide reductase NorE protein